MLIESIGIVSRRLPRGRGRIGIALHEHCGSKRVTFRDTNGHVRQADLSDPMESCWFAGSQRMGLTDRELAHVPEGGFALDLGANIGAVSGQILNRVGLQGQVWAFEPIPKNIRILESLREDNGLENLRIMPFAVGSNNEPQTIRLARDSNSAHASFVASWIDGDEVVVEVRTLDTLLADRDQKVSFVKIDIEGYEKEALTGAKKILTEDRPTILVEVNIPILSDRGSSAEELMHLFHQLGYSPEGAPPREELDVSNVLLLPR